MASSLRHSVTRSPVYSKFIASWVPWVKPDVIPDEFHFELNGFLNGWFVDPAQICHDASSSTIADLTQDYTTASTSYPAAYSSLGTPRPGCTVNPDGSYDIELTLEFFPQRWFYLGLLISGTTLVGCIGYLAYDFVRRRRARRRTETPSTSTVT